MMAVSLQTSFLTPPFGFALFYLRGVAPPEVTTLHIYRGVVPFVALQLFMLVLLAIFPGMPPGCRACSSADAVRRVLDPGSPPLAGASNSV